MRSYTRTEWLKIADRLNDISAQLDAVKNWAILSEDDLLLAHIRVASLQASLAADLAAKNA
ncbi:MAG: hypothetical protein E7E13_08335 [Actinomyces sp.]|uniref:hypothetical protein n=1 Tax=Actinomyces sp. TaxID=29317 RepID=UPI002904F249|nr:hypothetical protein [Actinomyces sp.]MDU2260206.1 hypothetical protein [Actinomyces sp.]